MRTGRNFPVILDRHPALFYPQGGEQIRDRRRIGGFANFSSIAIQIGGIGALVPERRGDLARLGVKAMIAGTLANFLSACIAGVLL